MGYRRDVCDPDIVDCSAITRFLCASRDLTDADLAAALAKWDGSRSSRKCFDGYFRRAGVCGPALARGSSDRHEYASAITDLNA